MLFAMSRMVGRARSFALQAACGLEFSRESLGQEGTAMLRDDKMRPAPRVRVDLVRAAFLRAVEPGGGRCAIIRRGMWPRWFVMNGAEWLRAVSATGRRHEAMSLVLTVEKLLCVQCESWRR